MSRVKSQRVVDFGLHPNDKKDLKEIIDLLSKLRKKLDGRSVEILNRNYDVIGACRAADRIADCEITLEEVFNERVE